MIPAKLIHHQNVLLIYRGGKNWVIYSHCEHQCCEQISQLNDNNANPREIIYGYWLPNTLWTLIPKQTESTVLFSVTIPLFRPCIFLRIAFPSLRRLEAPEYGLTIFPRNDTRCARPWMTLKMMSVRLMHVWYKTLFSFSIELPPRPAGACCMLMLAPGSQNVAPWKLTSRHAVLHFTQLTVR